MKNLKKNTRTLIFSLFAVSALSACGTAEKLANVGKAPQMTKIENPQLKANYKPVSMPMPAPEIVQKQPNSLWASNRKGFFKDQRASNVGDILTVLVDIEDEAELDNSTQRTRNGNEDANLPALGGYEQALNQILPEAVNPLNLTQFGSNSSSSGNGSTEREEAIELRLAAIITQILPNGNLVIDGSQEVRVNFEKRLLNVAGVIRPEDISINNTINHDQIAEARIIYGGEGHLTDVQQPRYGQQVYDILFPF